MSSEPGFPGTMERSLTVRDVPKTDGGQTVRAGEPVKPVHVQSCEVREIAIDGANRRALLTYALIFYSSLICDAAHADRAS